MTQALLALYAAVRGVIFIGLLGFIGTQAAGFLVARTAGHDPDLRTSVQPLLSQFPLRCSLLLLVAVLARGLLQVLSFYDPGDPITLDVARGVLLSGGWGHAWVLQVLAVAALVGMLWWRGARADPPDLATMMLGAVVLWAQTGMGHSASRSWPGALGRVLDFTHLLGGGLWLGTLTVLLIAALPSLRGESRLPTLANLVHRFSVFARVGVSLIVISGVVAALVYSGSIGALLHSTWGRLLLLKVASMVGVLTLGWYNWRVVTPALDAGQPTATRHLHRAIRFELLLGLVVLTITTMLVVSPLPGES